MKLFVFLLKKKQKLFTYLGRRKRYMHFSRNTDTSPVALNIITKRDFSYNLLPIISYCLNIVSQINFSTGVYITNTIGIS